MIPSGKWDRTLNNVDFISSANIRSNFKLAISFVVQKANFTEMSDFVSLGQKWGVDKISFTRIQNIGNHSAKEIEEVEVFNEKHPDFKNAAKILKDIKENTKDIEIQENCF